MQAKYELMLIDDMVRFEKDPWKFVLYAFPWGEPGPLKKDYPDKWQENLLKEARDKLSATKIDVNEAVSFIIQEAVASGHGIGKTALVAWIILWAMSTMADTRGVVTANTDTQLRTKTWAELAKWYQLCITKHWFKFTATALFAADLKHEKTWRIDAVPWSERNTEAFAGLHNQGKRILVIFDEASAIPNIIWEVTEGALTDKNTQIIWLVFGNPTRNTGRFRECFRKYRHRWGNRHIDSRTAKITNKEQLQKWIDDYGIESDFVKVRILGQFPSVSDRQWIPTALVDAARGKHLRDEQYNFAAKVIGVDPAWYGEDEFVINFRQGLWSKILATYPKNDNDIQMAGYIAKFEDEYKADAVFIDMGYGTGIYSAGRTMNRDWTLVAFAGESGRKDCLNKRMEMWYLMKEWLKEGGAIPDDQILYDDLIGPEYEVRLDGKYKLESKDDMKARGVPSPNRGDALAITFAFPVQPKGQNIYSQHGQFAIHEYNIWGDD